MFTRKNTRIKFSALSTLVNDVEMKHDRLRDSKIELWPVKNYSYVIMGWVQYCGYT